MIESAQLIESAPLTDASVDIAAPVVINYDIPLPPRNGGENPKTRQKFSWVNNLRHGASVEFNSKKAAHTAISAVKRYLPGRFKIMSRTTDRDQQTVRVWFFDAEQS